MSPLEWYYARGNKQMGPVSPAELKRLASAGELRPEDLVWREGMTEWTLARNVRGLFEEEGKAATAVAGEPSSRAAGTPSTVGQPASAPPRTTAAFSLLGRRRLPGRHLFDILLDGLRARFSAAFVEKTANIFRACGSYGLLVAMLLVAAFPIITASKAHNFDNIPSGVVVLLLLVALQYVAGKFGNVLEQLNRTTSSHLASTAFPDCCALGSLASGLAVLIGLLIAAVAALMNSAILVGLGTLIFALLVFMVFVYQTIVALNLTALNISIVPDLRAGEEAIGVATFSLKALLRLVPMAFGSGVIVGTILMGYACYQALSASNSDLGGMEGALGIGIRFPSEAVGAMAAEVAHSSLVLSAALPFVAYLVFLFYCLGIEVLRAFLVLPEKIDKLAEKGEGKPTGQP